MKIENIQSLSSSEYKLERKSKKGYSFKDNRWAVKFKMNGKQVSLGSYESEDEASFIYEKAKHFHINLNYTEQQIKLELMVFNKNLGRGLTNKNGLKGVYEKKGRFYSRFRTRFTSKNLGGFDTPEEAHAAYLKAKEEYREGNIQTS